VYRSGDGIQVTASLWDALDNRQIWSNTYSRPVSEMFLLGTDIATGLAGALNSDLDQNTQAPIQTPPTENQEALRHYLRGRHLIARWTEEGIRLGMEQFEEASKLDPDFALAYVGMSEGLMLLGDVLSTPGELRPVDLMPRARELILKALALEARNSEGHRILSFIRWYYDYDYDAAESEARIAIRLDPQNAAAWGNHGMLLTTVGRDEEAIAAHRRAIDLDPVVPGILSDFSASLYVAREYQDALEAAIAAMELDPNLSVAPSNAGYAELSMGNYESAITWFEKARKLSEHPYCIASLAYAHGRAGHELEARKLLNLLLEMRRKRYVAPRVLAIAHLGLGELDAAMDWFIRAAETRDPSVNLFDIRAQHCDTLRSHPRYPQLLRTLRLDQRLGVR
jgi:serine/threonine-protein kinase